MSRNDCSTFVQSVAMLLREYLWLCFSEQICITIISTIFYFNSSLYYLLLCVQQFYHVLLCVQHFYHVLLCVQHFYHVLLCVQHFYHVLMCMRRPQGRGLELARKHIASCLSELECIYKSAEFLRSSACGNCEDGIEDKTTASGCEPIGFDASLNSRLSAPTPPRAIRILNWKKAIEYFKKLLHHLDIICSYSLDPSLEAVLRFVVQFQKPQPDLVARAHLQLLLVQDGKLYGRDPIFAVICRAAALPEVVKNHDIQKNEFVVQLGQVSILIFFVWEIWGMFQSKIPEDVGKYPSSSFLSKMILISAVCSFFLQLVINLLKILCTNAAWQRRKLGKILQDWRVIYVQVCPIYL
ncbi:hypothetical protein CK203_052232 [Vitis vinifera]|uniref:NAA35-like TPR repeats domain-containing protein n=1 Tax=Vitis vinifera TaxID=29760 RepID=A0A438GPE4_VITVI|nr:hypothetical protein CK203_052232 [Vitis vinifera]